MEYEFPTVPGQAYLVEGTVSGLTWVTVAGPVFGDGQAAKAMLPLSSAAYRQFRVRPVPAADYGPATTALGGKTVSLNDNGRARQLIFFPVIQGVKRGILKTDGMHARSFVWEIRRGSAAGVSIQLQFFDGTSSTVDLTFSNGQLGSYQMRDRNAAGAVQVMEAGLFSTHHGRIRDNANQAVLPVSLVGQSIGFEEGGELTRMDFTTRGNVLVTGPDGTTRLEPYQYDVSGPGAADLRVGVPGVMADLFRMLLSSQATGTFNRVPQILPNGGPAAPAQPGTFNLPTGPVVTNSATGPPASLGGKVLQLGGNDPATLSFNSDGTGTETREDNGSVEVTPFTYDYSPTDDNEASLALTFPGADNDRVEDYDLDFSGSNSGSYQSSVYEGGELAQSNSGNFNTGGG